MNNRYLIISCPRCHEFIIADSHFKNKTCPKCALRFPVEGLRVIRFARDARQAREIVSQAKAIRGGLHQR